MKTLKETAGGLLEARILLPALGIIAAVALLWKPVLSKIFSAGGLLGQLGGLLGEGGLVSGAAGQAVEGLGYVFEYAEEGLEVSFEYLGQQIICGGDSGAAVAVQMQSAGISAANQIFWLQKKAAGTLPGYAQRFEKYIDYGRFIEFWTDIERDAAGDLRAYQIQAYATAEKLALFQWHEGSSE